MKKRAIERKERRRRRGRQLERALPHNTHTYLGAISGPLSSFFFFFLSFHCSCSVSFSLSLSCHIQWVCWLAGWLASKAFYFFFYSLSALPRSTHFYFCEGHLFFPSSPLLFSLLYSPFLSAFPTSSEAATFKRARRSEQVVRRLWYIYIVRCIESYYIRIACLNDISIQL